MAAQSVYCSEESSNGPAIRSWGGVGGYGIFPDPEKVDFFFFLFIFLAEGGGGGAYFSLRYLKKK